MADDAFVYTTYIGTSPERLWRALTDPAFTRRYWGATFDTDWAPGSPMVWHYAGATATGPEQVVLESYPYRRLAYTWHTFTPEMGAATGMDEETLARLTAEPRSKVTFDIEPVEEGVRLTVVHDGFEPGGALLAGIGEGWPRILSALKTLLETGDEALEAAAR
ncbi:hypothetical protein GCM10009530_60490 [Microbispora corallina]|uniref:Activator of Hsp90 ATPase homologue 1/2-like C-terminal domain-containing protein n=1 Tax=Microbispora corallina TaxID=83302 RepID=A0ABQ4FZ31_9ACTN|nr:SRPBCC family protein [Microbispora corallina]GIH40035.1 hypothetical protein Mco01_30350 [Microbispora corallina]